MAVPSALVRDFRWILRNALRDHGALCVAHDAPVSGHLVQRGLHHHDDWEMFCIIRGTLRFNLAGRPPSAYKKGSVLIVPPECLHCASNLSQHRDLHVLIMHVPKLVKNCGSLGIFKGNHVELYSALSIDQHAKWAELLGESPETIMDRILKFQERDEWGKYHALALLRVLLAAFAEVSTSSQSHLDMDEQRASKVLFYLQNHYYESELSLHQIAGFVGLSVSRLTCLFRKSKGHTVQQTLIDIRLRRAMTLITQTCYSIKEISGMTGWGSQLYFSAAFHRRFGCSPSFFRNEDFGKNVNIH